MQWDCTKCQAKGHDKTRNCDGKTNPKFVHITKQGSRFKRCPKSWQANEAVRETHWFTDWVYLDRFQMLPRAGGLLDQCPKFIEAVNIITGVKNRLEAAQNGKA